LQYIGILFVSYYHLVLAIETQKFNNWQHFSVCLACRPPGRWTDGWWCIYNGLLPENHSHRTFSSQVTNL